MPRMLNILLLLATGATAEIQVVGEAFLIDSERLVYREMHATSNNGLDQHVEYRNQAGHLIAEKTLDYRSGEQSPGFKQQDYRSDKQQSIRWQGKSLVMESVSDGETIAKQLKLSSPGEVSTLVIDAGFDAFIRLHWDELIKGEQLPIIFPLVNQGRMIALQLKKSACSYAGEQEYCFRLEAANWMIRLLTSMVELGYDKDSRLLKRYLGLSNLEDARGESMMVDIHYYYLTPDNDPQTSNVIRI